MNPSTHLKSSVQLQPILKIRFASFARRYSNSYDSCQELTHRILQNGFRFCRGV